MEDLRYLERRKNGAYRLKVHFPSLEEAMAARDLLLGPGEVPAPEALPLERIDTTDGDIWAALESLQAVYQRQDEERDSASVTINDDRPCLLVYFDDAHIGHQFCDMPRLRHDLQLAGSTPGVYVMGGGDIYENVIESSPAGSQFEQIARPKLQKLLVEQSLSWVQGKVLAMVLGNHPARSIRDDDFDPCAYFAHKAGCVYFGPWGLLTVGIGSQTYRLLLAHSFRMRSSFNKTHSAKRMLDLVEDADAVFTGHTHDPASESAYVRQRARFFGQAGTYLTHSGYAKGLGFGPGQAEMPGAILFPKERKLLGVHDAFVEGIHLLSSYRKDVQCRCAYCRGEGA